TLTWAQNVTREDCMLPFQKGRCRAYIDCYHWDVESKSCKKFGWGGCGGNKNRFVSNE
ncbi:unnamed protein product, partial [Allacma fusca]